MEGFRTLCAQYIVVDIRRNLFWSRVWTNRFGRVEMEGTETQVSLKPGHKYVKEILISPIKLQITIAELKSSSGGAFFFCEKGFYALKYQLTRGGPNSPSTMSTTYYIENPHSHRELHTYIHSIPKISRGGCGDIGVRKDEYLSGPMADCDCSRNEGGGGRTN